MNLHGLAVNLSRGKMDWVSNVARSTVRRSNVVDPCIHIPHYPHPNPDSNPNPIPIPNPNPKSYPNLKLFNE